ncbi:MAG: hypothetical protein IKN96_01380 [Oscillibacter sp.]|nr:hypothetical protein [Oscillibacter sp.]
MSDRRFKRLLSVQLAAAVALGAAIPANAAQIVDDGVRPACDEAYYATTDYYGNLTNGSVVKSYVLRGAESLTDYGDYDEVVNLSDGTAPVRRDDEITFRFGQDAPKHFYFEGKTKKPFENLPWTLKVNYRLNGVPVKAEDLGGKTGLAEINIDAVPNENAEEYAKNNYVLTAAAVFNQDDILSLEAPGAQTQLIGNLRAVLFLAFPGEEQHFSIRVGAEEFSFDGLTFMMVPATLSQLDEVAKLSEKKTDLEDSYHELSDSLDTVLDAFNGMQSSLYETANGLDRLEQARKTISDGKGAVYGALDRTQVDLETLAGALSPVTRHAEEAEAFLTDGKNALNALTDTILQMNGKLSGLEDSMKALEGGMGRMESGLSDVESGLSGLEKSLVSVELGLEDTASGLDDTASSLTAVDTGLADAESGLESMEQDIATTENSMENLEGNLELLEANLEKLEGGLKDLEDGSADVKRILKDASDLKSDLNMLGDALDDTGIPSRSNSGSSVGLTQGDLDNVQQIAKLYSLTASGATPDEAAFYAAMLAAQGQDAETAATVAGLFMSGNLEVIAAQGLAETYQGLKALYNAPDFRTFAAAILQQRGYSEDDAKTTAKQMEQVWTLCRTPEGAAALELLLSSMSNIDNSITGVTRSANNTLTDVSGMAANVMWDLADLCKELDDLTDMVDDAQKVSEILRDSSGDLRTLTSGLRDTSAILRTVMGDLRGTSGDLRDASAALRGASEPLEDTLRSLADLLESLVGASARLRGLTSDLRGTSAAVRDVSATARAASEKVRGASETARHALNDADALRKVLNAYEPSARSALETLKSLTGISTSAIRDANDLIAKTEALLKAGGNQLDAGTKDTLQGLTATIRKAADGMDSTKDLQSAKNTITDLIEDTWDEYSGDANNLLNMDSGAEARSLTSPENPAPQSVQVLIRTQEIKAGETSETVETSVKKDKGTFFNRLGQMFLDFWRAVTGLFH